MATDPHNDRNPPDKGFRHRAGDEVRTRDIQLGRLTLYQLSYSRGSGNDTTPPGGAERCRPGRRGGVAEDAAGLARGRSHRTAICPRGRGERRRSRAIQRVPPASGTADHVRPPVSVTRTPSRSHRPPTTRRAAPAQVPVDLAGPAGAPRVVLVHGIGVGPGAMAEVARRLARRARVVVVHRRGYGRAAGRAPAATVADQVADLMRAIDAAGADRAVLAGVGAGASIALAAAIAHPGRVAGVVAHEPFLGTLAPGAHGLLAAAAGALEQVADPLLAMDALAMMLLGARAAAALPASVRDDLRAAASAAAAEVPGLADFAPGADGLRVLAGMPVVASAGARSRSQRMEATRVLAVHARAQTVVVPRCGHLVQLDAPGALVRAVGATLTAR